MSEIPVFERDVQVVCKLLYPGTKFGTGRGEGGGGGYVLNFRQVDVQEDTQVSVGAPFSLR